MNVTDCLLSIRMSPIKHILLRFVALDALDGILETYVFPLIVHFRSEPIMDCTQLI